MQNRLFLYQQSILPPMKPSYFSLLLLLSAIISTSGCVSNAPTHETPDPQYGMTIETAIEVCKPVGQRQYLSRLICPDGQSPYFYRTGNVGMRTPWPENLTPAQEREYAAKCGQPIQPGDPDHHIIDRYHVQCGEHVVMIYMDMYHCNQPAPNVAPAGFTIRP